MYVVEKMLSQLTGDMYEFYQWLKSKCSGVVGVDITYGKTHYDGSEDVCMTFQLKYQWENEIDKRKDAGIHKIITILEYIAKKFSWDIDIKWFNSYRAATDDVLMIKVINQKENLTTKVKSKMKKLNITKEQFEKSKYFKDKYGDLEYVSESGKVFKTNKGKILMFKEGVFGDIGDAIDSGVSGVRKFFHGKPKFKKGDIVMLCLADFSPSKVHHGEEIEGVKWNGKCWEYKMGNDPFGNAQWWPEDRVAEDPEPDKGSEPYVPEKFPEFSKFKKFAKEGTESNPRFKCMEGRNEYSDEIREFMDDVVSALKKCYGDEYMVKPDMMDYKGILVSDPYAGLDYKIDISVSDEVDW